MLAKQNSLENNRILEIRDQLEDKYLLNSQYKQGLDYLNKVTDPIIREDPSILCLEAKIQSHINILKSKQIYQSLFEKHPQYFKSTFEYFMIMNQYYSEEYEEFSSKILSFVYNSQKNSQNEDNAYFLILKILLLDLKKKKNVELSKHLIIQALAKLEKTCQKSDMYIFLAKLQYRFEQYSNARKYLYKAMNIHPQNNEVNFYLASCALKENNLNEAKYYIDKMLQHQPYSQPGLDFLSTIYELQKDFEKAEQAYILMFQNNQNVFLLYHANFAQFLYLHKFNDPNKRLQVLEYFKNGFIQNPVESNPNFADFNSILEDTQKIAKAMYQYKFIMYLMEFLDTIRTLNPQLLQKLGTKIFKILQDLQKLEIDEQFEDTSDNDDFTDDDIDNEEEEEQKIFEQQNQQNTKISENSKISSSLQSKDNYHYQMIEGNQIYQDPNLVKPISIHQKVLTYQLIYYMIYLNIKQNTIFYSLILYNKFIQENLQYKSNIQFWDLYID
ncbi:hypothetical protein ABPG74_018170 [Tetrahymena malaccensis]